MGDSKVNAKLHKKKKKITSKRPKEIQKDWLYEKTLEKKNRLEKRFD